MRPRQRRASTGCVMLAGALAVLLPALVEAQTTRVSIGPGAVDADGASWSPAISADGRWIAFMSDASNLVGGDTNGRADVFVYDRQAGTTTRVSVGPGGVQGNRYSTIPAISADGRRVVFMSLATNLVAGDTNGYLDVFVHDRQTGITTRVSVGAGGAQGNGDSYTSYAPVISADGRWVAFQSDASNLVPGDTNGARDVFVHDGQTGTTTRASVAPGGVPGNSYSWSPSISADGRWVAFQSSASNLVTGDTNGREDVFVYDQQTGTTTRVSAGIGGAQGNGESVFPAISADGRWVAFMSQANNLVTGDTNGREDVFVYDRQTGTTTRESLGPGDEQANGHSFLSAISADGRSVAFQSSASNLVTGDTNGYGDVFVRDRLTGMTTRVSVGTGGDQGNADSTVAGTVPAISANGRWVAFMSLASNLVASDTNAVADIFLHDRGDTGCSVTLAPSSASAPATGATGSILALGAAECAWTAVANDPSWLSVTAGSSGTGFGTVSYTVTTNPTGPRTGTVTIGGQAFTVNQEGGDVLTPLPPAGLVAHALVGNLVTLRWVIQPGGVPPAAFALEGGVIPGEVLASLPTGSVDPTVTFIAPTGSFYVRVHGLNGPFRSGASNEILIHVDVPVAPSAPGNLLGLVNGSTLSLAWTNTYAGGTPTSLVLDVTGAIVSSLPLAVVDSFSFAGVPAGTYTLALRAQNAGGTSPPSNAVTLTFPGACSGPPLIPTNLLAYRIGSTVFVDWAPAVGGPAPTGYVLNVTGSYVGSFATPARAMSGTVGPGSYTVSGVAINPCGASPATAPQTVIVP